jgi:peptide/nickel transport system substrate-binding protein
MMNQAIAPFDNENARRAVILATDSAGVADAVGEGTLQAIDQPFADGTPFFVDDARYPEHDLEAAKAAVEQYIEETGEPLAFTLTAFTGTHNLALSQILQSQWQQAGIDVQIETVQQAAAIQELITGQLQATLTPNFAYPDPDFYYNLWHSSFTAPVGQLSINFPHMAIDELDQALTDGRESLDEGARRQAYATAAPTLNENFVASGPRRVDILVPR